MSTSVAVSPFVPGYGGLPPYLAGRHREQNELRRLLAYLESGRGAPRSAVLTGPRGNGKTALLRWFQRDIESGKNDIDVIWLTPSEIPGLDVLATELVPPGRFSSLRPETLSFSVGIGRLGWELGDRPRSLTRLLVERCNRQPLVVLLDEAQNLNHQVGHALLNASQSVAAASPFLLVMAGTPELQAHLDTLLATFWNRARQIGVGRLDEDAAAAAVVNPLAGLSPSITFVNTALERVVAESQCYPYFLQLWGDALWHAANDVRATRIDDAVVAAAQPAFQLERTTYYEDRRDELKRRELLRVAARVAPAFHDTATLADHELDTAIAAALPAGASNRDVLRCQRDLANVGYVWKPPGAGSVWQPGMPSLMGYIESHAH